MDHANVWLYTLCFNPIKPNTLGIHLPACYKLIPFFLSDLHAERTDYS